MSDHYDLLIKNATIIDGTGNSASKGSVGIRGEQITAVGTVNGDEGREIDGSDLVACPGFIDIHSHADHTILWYPLAESFVMQGVTTFVGGNCGMSPAPIKNLMPAMIPFLNGAPAWWQDADLDEGSHSLSSLYSYIPLDRYGDLVAEKMGFAADWRTLDEFLSTVESAGLSVNYVPLVGHNAIRIAAMGEDFKRPATLDEIALMEKHVHEAMESGAIGLCTGLDSSPGEYASLDEILRLARVAQHYGGTYHTHTRHHQNNYPTDNLEECGYGLYHGSPDEITVGRYRGLLEAVDICRQAEIRLQISHITSAYIINQPCPDSLHRAAAEATLQDIIDGPQREGLDLAFDLIPDESAGVFSTPGLLDVFAAWLPQFGSATKLLDNLREPAFRDQVRQAIDSGRFKILMLCPKTDPYWPEHFVVLRCANGTYEGKTFGQVARMVDGDGVDAMCELLGEDPDTKFNQRDLRRLDQYTEVFLQHPSCMIGIDSCVHDTEFHIDTPFPNSIMAHQNAYGMFPQYIRRFVREKGVLSLEAAIRKATSAPAQQLGLKKRGTLRVGSYADIVLFDADRISEGGDWLTPAQPPAGIECVLVNGKIAYEKMRHTETRSGKVLRRA